MNHINVNQYTLKEKFKSIKKSVSGIPVGLKCETRYSCWDNKGENLLVFVPVLKYYLFDISDTVSDGSMAMSISSWHGMTSRH
jgi:hypothetical protein